MKTFITTEMMVHVAMCTHKNPHKIMVVSEQSDLLKGELARYRDIEASFADAKDLLGTLRNSTDKSIDVLLLDAQSDDAAVFAHANPFSRMMGLWLRNIQIWMMSRKIQR